VDTKMSTITQLKEDISALAHGGTLNKVRSIESLFRRAANTMLLKVRPLETIRLISLSETVSNIQTDYDLPSDYNAIIDLYPQANRQSLDQATRVQAERFDLKRALQDKTVSIESSEGAKFIRIDWATRAARVLSNMDTFDGNGTWAAVATASGVETDKITKFSGGGSVRFDSAASGDGIDNTTLAAIDLTNEDEVADNFVRFYIKDSTDLALLTSATCIWGIDLTTNFWTGVAQTAQEGGTDFKVGWNKIKTPWSTATESGTVTPASIDSFRITFATTGAISDIRVDEISFAIGKSFDLKYYSKYLLKDTSGTWLSKTTSDDDVVVLDEDGIQIYTLEILIAMAQQLEGTDSAFDITFAKEELKDLYPAYKGQH
ncbi:hypothetical protein LCGC14_2952870, partial [marine sediment metagenome]